MNVLFTVLVTFFAGMGAGLGTGFAGMSAAAVITPMLVTFLGIEPYTAVGIALASDVLASAVSAYTYGKNKKNMPAFSSKQSCDLLENTPLGCIAIQSRNLRLDISYGILSFFHVYKPI